MRYLKFSYMLCNFLCISLSNLSVSLASTVSATASVADAVHPGPISENDNFLFIVY